MKLRLEIKPDPDPLNPREDYSLGTMVCFHKKYTLGDFNHGIDINNFDSWEAMEEYIWEERDAVAVLPLYLYIHGGITMRVTPFNDRFYSGQVGFIYMTKDEANTLLQNGSRSSYVDCLKEEVKEYDQYLTGDIWGFELWDDDEGELVESLWGIHGEEEAKSEGQRAFDYYEERGSTR